jgi:integrase
LVLTHETGHRITLQWSDIDLQRKEVTWRTSNDKIGWEHTTPLTDDALAALAKARTHHPAIGSGWVLPAPRGAEQPCDRTLTVKWFRRAASLAEVRLPPRAGFHSLR